MKKLLKDPIFLSSSCLFIVLIIVVAVLMSNGNNENTVSDAENLVVNNVGASGDVSADEAVPSDTDNGKEGEELSGPDASDTDVSRDEAVTGAVADANNDNGTENPKEEIGTKEENSTAPPAGEADVETDTQESAKEPVQGGETNHGKGDGAQSNQTNSDQSGQNSQTKPGQNTGNSTGSTPSQSGANSQGSGGGTVVPHSCAWNSGVVTTQATCSKEGVRTYTCSCGKTKTESIAKAGHNYVTESTPATCTEAGSIKTLCSMCGDVQSETAGEAAKGHVPGEKYYWYGPPSCTQSGYYALRCATCSEWYTDGTDPALPHTTAERVIVEPTCNTTGIKNVYCTVCGRDWDDGSLPKLGNTQIPKTENHTWVVENIEQWNEEKLCYELMPTEYCKVCNKVNGIVK